MFLTKAGKQQQSQNFYDRQYGLVGCCLKTNAQIFAKTKTSEHNFKCFWQKLKPDTAFLYLKVLWWWNMHRCTDGTCCYISSKPREQPCHHPRWPEATQGDRRPPARETSDNVVTEGYTFWLFSVQKSLKHLRMSLLLMLVLPRLNGLWMNRFLLFYSLYMFQALLPFSTFLTWISKSRTCQLKIKLFSHSANLV